MATVKGILGQLAPVAATPGNLYTVPAAKNATVKVIAANRAGATTIRVWIAIDAAVDSNEQYIAYEQELPANAARTTVSVIVGNADVVRVQSASGSVSFTCTGIEQDD